MRYKMLLLVGAVVVGSWVKVGIGAPPQTRLYVRTIPSGASVFLDGKEVGRTDGLFVLDPGLHKVRLEMEGRPPQERQVEVPAQQITRLVVEFRQVPASSPSRPGLVEAGTEAVSAWIGQTDLPAEARQAMLTVLRQHPDQTRWSGRSGTTLFGLACKAMPGGAAGAQAGPAVMNLTHLLAVQELLKAKSLLDRYAAAGLADATTLGLAVAEAAGKFHIAGQVKSFQFQSAVRSSHAVAYVLAQEQDLTAYLLAPAEVETVRLAYRDVMHAQARDLMKRGNYADALLLWKHLHSRKLVSQSLYLDAASCLRSLGQNDDAIRVLTEAVEAFSQKASAEFFERAGDVALSIDSPAAQQLAEDAYRRASKQLLNSVSPTTRPAEDGLGITDNEQPPAK